MAERILCEKTATSVMDRSSHTSTTITLRNDLLTAAIKASYMLPRLVVDAKESLRVRGMEPLGSYSRTW